jgi:hypothetical protein
MLPPCRCARRHSRRGGSRWLPMRPSHRASALSRTGTAAHTEPSTAPRHPLLIARVARDFGLDLGELDPSRCASVRLRVGVVAQIKAGSSARALSRGRSCSQPHSSIPTSRRRPPLPLRTSSDPRRGSRSCSASASASWTPSPARQSTMIVARSRHPWLSFAGVAHDGDDLLDGGRVGGIADALVARRAAGVVAGHGRRRTAPPSRVEH